MTFSWAGNLLMAFCYYFPLREQKACPYIYTYEHFYFTLITYYTYDTFTRRGWGWDGVGWGKKSPTITHNHKHLKTFNLDEQETQ